MDRDEYVKFVKSTALDLGKRTVMSALVKKAPIFASGPLSFIAILIIGKILEYAIMQSEFGAFFLYVDLRVDRQGFEFEKAAREWYDASPNEKINFEGAYLEKFYNVARLTT